MQWIRNHLRIVVPLGLAVSGLVAYLAFGVFAVQALFIDDRVDEVAPAFASGAGEPLAPDSSVPVTSSPPAVAPPPTQVPLPTGVPAPTDVPATASAGTPAPVATPAPIVTLVQGQFIARDHSGEGTASVLTDGSSQRFLRFENFSTENGPDLNVYLVSSDANAAESTYSANGEFVDLGNLKGNIGDQNYEIPPDVDLARFDTVVVWCVRFSSAFVAADLTGTT